MKSIYPMTTAFFIMLSCILFTPLYAESENSSNDVLPLHFAIPLENADGFRAEISERVYTSLMKQAQYLLEQVKPWKEDSELLLLTESKSGEHWIRPNTGTVAGLSFLYRFGPYDDRAMRANKTELFEFNILPMMRYLITTHVTGTRPTSDGKPWGDAWQSAHWAHMLGRAGWWLWDELPEDIQEGIRRVVKHEASRFVDQTPPHQIRNDTKAEENAWNAQIFPVAALLMPNDPMREKWEDEFQCWAMSSFLRPADKNSNTIVDGKPVSEHFTGANIYNDFTLENHRLVHPDYMTTFSLTLSCVLDFIMTHRKEPEAMYYNIDGIYENLKWFSLPDGGFVYPSGQDWRLFRNPDWFFPHTLMATFGQDTDAWTLAMRSFTTQEKMQARPQHSAIYLDEEYFFPSTQTDRLYSLSLAWLTLKLGPPIKDSFNEKKGVLRLDSGKIIMNHTGKAIHTFSWGAKVMAQTVANRLDRIVSPHLRSGIGWIRLKGDKEPLPISIHNVSVKNDDNNFHVELVLNHGENQFRSYLQYGSNADGSWTVKEKLVALSEVETVEIATGLLGILNNPHWVYENGKRNLNVNSVEEIIPACSGKVIQSNEAKRITIDDALIIESEQPLQIRYKSSKKPERGRVTDELSLHYVGEEKQFHSEDVITEYKYTAHIR